MSGRVSKTLFVSQIGREVDTRTVETAFRKYDGFKVVRRFPNFTFVEFESTDAASKCMKELQGHKFPGDTRGIVIDYDKDHNKDADRKRKDYPERDHMEDRRADRDRQEASNNGSEPKQTANFPQTMSIEGEPSKTLFVTSLPSGFHDVRLVLKDDRVSGCFVDFLDSHTATMAMGYKLDNNCEGMSLEYDRHSNVRK